MDVSSFLRPFVPNVVLWFWVALALLTLWMTRSRRWARWLGLLILAGLWLAGTRPAAEMLIGPLEDRTASPSPSTLRTQGVHVVVVLMGGSFALRGEMLSSGIGGSSLPRFMSGLELCTRLGDGCRLIFSGSASELRAHAADAETLQQLAHLLAPNREIVAETRSRRTADHPANLGPLLGRESFVLVTSAVHMPRALSAFRRAGLSPIPYPVEFQVLGNYRWDDWVPSGGNLETVDIALKEYLAGAFYASRGP